MIQNVSQGVRAFFLSGQKVRFDGIDPHTGEKRYKAVSALQDQAGRKMTSIPRNAPGSYVDFQVSPTITAFGAMTSMSKQSGATVTLDTLNSDGLMDLLSADFARSLKDFAAILNDLERLSTLGDLPISLHDRSIIRVRFPGCDAETVERLCDEVNVSRGRIVQDEDFELRTGAGMALLFPFAPSIAPSDDVEYLFEQASQHKTQPSEHLDWHDMLTPQSHLSPDSGLASGTPISFDDKELFGSNPWTSSPSAYSSINVSELGDRVYFPDLSNVGSPESTPASDGAQGIYNFLAECDRARR